MILDFTAKQILGQHGFVPGAEHEFPASDWRNLLVADRDLGTRIERQALALASAHFGIELVPPAEPALCEVSCEPWTNFAANALACGLAYGPLSATSIARANGASQIAELLKKVLGQVRSPSFASNWLLPKASWNPVTSQTFDACLVAFDQSLVVLVFVVDED